MTMDPAEYSGLAQSVLDRLVEEFGETAHLARGRAGWPSRVAAGIVSQMVLWVITSNVTVYACN